MKKQSALHPQSKRPLCLFLFLFALLLLTGLAWGQDKNPAALFTQANTAYNQGAHQQAIELYQTIQQDRGVSAALLYNLGNSYAALGDTGQAVLHYEQALLLAPGNPDIQANLEQVRKKAGLYRDDLPLYIWATRLLGADHWLLLSGIALLTMALGALAWAISRGKTRDRARLVMLGALPIFLLALPPAWLRYRSWRTGVVTQEDARLLISPFSGAASAGGIKAGRMIEPEKKYGNYVFVEDETGRSGWLDRDSLQLLTAPVSYD